MNKVVKGAILGGVVGIAAPIALAIGNEFLFASSNGSSAEAKICFANRVWNLQRIQVRHAPGCKNKILERAPQVFLLSILAGSAGGGGLGLSLLASKSTGRKRTTQIPGLRDVKNETIVPAEPKKEEVAQEPAVETNRKIELEGFDLDFVAKSVIIGSIIAGIGFATIKALETNQGNNANPNPLTSIPGINQEYCAKSTNGYTICIKKEDISCNAHASNGEYFDICKANGTSTDLAGKKEHYQTSDYCIRGRIETDFACTSARHFGIITY